MLTLLCACIISLKRGSALNTHSDDFIRKDIERVTSRKNATMYREAGARRGVHFNPECPLSVASYPGSSTEKRGGSLEGCIPQLLSKLESYWSTLYTQSIRSYVN